ncbi:2-dehydro-3-deoxygalactonokinase [Clostridium sp.]|uniref:2-dehydro-3-deoxygalactonokinase n=1 Tax=Clostridium sp. TaxID=1506 RepID=UPI001A4107EB|nr:2-dehydro-3-deoxygalactonokinase [Clostridium sp.]MBK5242377.1 2-dehydro-3-deoxygalactonokinase [Clostridium sp.]
MNKTKYSFTIDGGTTNTRVSLWNSELKEIDSEAEHIGIKDVAVEGSNKRLQQTIKNILDTLILRNHMTYYDINCILAAGMITSNLGIYELDHLVAPVSIEDLVSGIKSVKLDDICPIPISFIPGIKNMSTDQIKEDNFDRMDIMRGEEVEVVSILNQIDNVEMNSIIVLPGSHTKFVAVGENRNILGCVTSLTGELLSLLQTQSILTDATGKDFLRSDEYDSSMCLMGYEKAKELGTGRAAFLTRIIKLFLKKTDSQRSSYLLGVVLQNDVKSLEYSLKLFNNDSDYQIIIAGKDPFRTALYDIFMSEEKFKNILYFDAEGINLSANGCLLLAKVKGLL